VCDIGGANSGFLLERIAERLADGFAWRAADIGDGDRVGAECTIAGPDRGRRKAERGRSQNASACVFCVH